MKQLEGIRVLDFSHGVAGPYATMILGDLGAEVIKIEKPGRGDVSRFLNMSPRFAKDIPRSGGDYFLTVNRNKQSVALDLGEAAGKDIALRLAGRADVVVQSFRPGVMTRLGLGPEAVRKVNPSVIYASISAYGNAGPLAGYPGMDVAVQARSGVMSLTGEVGGNGSPLRPGVSLADFSGGVHLAVSILAGLLQRGRTRKGSEVSVSLLDATMSMLSNYSVAVLGGGKELGPMGSGHPQIVPYQAFPTSDGFVVISTGTNKLFRALCDVLELSDVAADARFATNPLRVSAREEVVALISARTRGRSTAQWLSVFEANGIPCSPVNTIRQAMEDPQLSANGMIVEYEHPVYGLVRSTGSPYKSSAAEATTVRPPLLGEHTAEVLGSVLGMGADEVAQLRKRGIIEQSEHV